MGHQISHFFTNSEISKWASKQTTKCSGASEQRRANEWDNGAHEWASGWANGPIASLSKPPSGARWLVQGIGCLAQLHIQLGTIGQQMIPYTFILSGLIDDDKAIRSHWSRVWGSFFNFPLFFSHLWRDDSHVKSRKSLRKNQRVVAA